MGDLKPALPVVLDLTGRLVVAVGGGPVSARRVRAFLDEGAVVRVISPWLCEDLRELALAGSVAARADVTTPDGRVTVAAYAAGDPGLAVTVRDGVERALVSGALDLRRTRTHGRRGWVALVGGGPGTDGLLTTRGHELLASADVVVVDRLAPRAVLDRLPASVRVIDVGKTPGHHPVPQSRINDLLVEEARRGLGVVRLKGGDPYVLGRGGEERDACEAHGIRVEVVPG